MDDQKCNIKVTSSDGITQVMIDGKDCSRNLTGVSFDHDAGELPKVEFGLSAIDFAIQGDVVTTFAYRKRLALILEDLLSTNADRAMSLAQQIMYRLARWEDE